MLTRSHHFVDERWQLCSALGVRDLEAVFARVAERFQPKATAVKFHKHGVVEMCEFVAVGKEDRACKNDA